MRLDIHIHSTSQGDLIMIGIQDLKDKLVQLTADVAALQAVHTAGVVVAQADLDALAASMDAVDASVKALATPAV